MSRAARIALCGVVGVLALGQMACNAVPRSYLAQSQLRTRQLYQQNRALMADRENQIRTSQNLASENQRLQQQMGDMQASRDTLQQRIDNLLSERSQLQSRFASIRQTPSPLSDSSTRQFEELARKYPDFEFDPQTGVSKFHSDVLFESGSADLRNAAEPLLRDFAKILGTGDANQLNILVVGHTDDRPVGKPGTRARHPDNWYLSAHRAINVTHTLSKFGIKEKRMGVAGYGPHQPLASNSDDKSRQRNRRVEIFVLAPNASMAGWDTGTRVK